MVAGGGHGVTGTLFVFPIVEITAYWFLHESNAVEGGTDATDLLAPCPGKAREQGAQSVSGVGVDRSSD